MVARTHLVRYTFEEYLALDESSEVKHEYLDGMIYAMAGGTPEHSALAMSVATKLANQLAGGRCRVHSSDLRVRVAETGLTTYPDVTVVCGPWERDPASATTIVNPSVVVEVASKGTQAYDRGEKLEHYLHVPSLLHVVLVAHERRELEVWARVDGAWTRALFVRGQTAPLPGIGCALPVDAVYDDAAEPTA